ncbi:MAG: radical SAM protein [Candidatus Cloacimonetes bacterium]|nr:radical SAM protein [Candidatus Cloacimonadota bacterium]MCK9332741.1 radical SAM protein [Candidatus Cloacimonadota bacterium]
MECDERTIKKAELSLGGGIKLPKGFVMPYRLSQSTAGPGAGSTSAVFSFDDCRVKKAISYDVGEFDLNVSQDGTLFLTKNNEVFLKKVEIKPVVFHCPEQAFFNLDQRCIYNCAFCASPRLDKNITKGLTDTDIVVMIKDAMEDQKVVSVSLTSGVIENAETTVKRFISCVKAIRAEFPNIPIGVEPYISGEEDLRSLKDAGATEIKLNIEAANKTIFSKVCPELDYDLINEMLVKAVKVFGKGKVSSNIIYGLGETDGELRDIMGRLASDGVIPGLRALRYNPYNRESLRSAIGDIPKVTPERAIRVSKMQKTIMERYGLTTMTCNTMCLECTCCDIVPFRDI